MKSADTSSKLLPLHSVAMHQFVIHDFVVMRGGLIFYGSAMHF